MKFLRLVLANLHAQEDPHDADDRLVRGGAVPLRSSGDDPRRVLPGRRRRRRRPAHGDQQDLAHPAAAVLLQREDRCRCPASPASPSPAGSAASTRTRRTSSRSSRSTRTPGSRSTRSSVIPRDQWRAFLPTARGASSARDLAKRFGFKVGDRIPLKGTICAGDLGVQRPRHLRRAAAGRGRRPSCWFRYDYLEERGRFGKGIVGWYVVRLADPDARRRGDRGDRRAVRQLAVRDQDRDREGVRRLVRQADGQHRAAHPDHRRRRLLHAPAGDRQHDGDLGARADRRARGAQDDRLLRPARPRPGAGRVGPDRRCRAGCSGVLLAKAASRLGGDPTRCWPDVLPAPLELAGGVALALAVGLLAGAAPGGLGDAPAASSTRCGGCEHGDPARLQRAQRARSAGPHASSPCWASPARSACSSRCWRWRSGFRATLVASGSPRNAIVLRAGADLRDGQRASRSTRCTSSRTRRAWRGTRDGPLVTRARSWSSRPSRCERRAPTPTCRCAACRRGVLRRARQRARSSRAASSAGPGRAGRRARTPRDLRGVRPRHDASGSAAARGPSSASSTPAAAPSTPRCGATPTSSTRSTSGPRTSSSR